MGGAKSRSALDLVFRELRELLTPYASHTVVIHDTGDQYYLDTRHVMPNRKPLFFAATRLGKAYVSFYLMPVYMYPELVKAATPALRKRMQGKSCFNFRTLDVDLVSELRVLTASGFERYREAGYV